MTFSLRQPLWGEATAGASMTMTSPLTSTTSTTTTTRHLLEATTVVRHHLFITIVIVIGLACLCNWLPRLFLFLFEERKEGEHDQYFQRGRYAERRYDRERRYHRERRYAEMDDNDENATTASVDSFLEKTPTSGSTTTAPSDHDDDSNDDDDEYDDLEQPSSPLARQQQGQDR